MKNDRAKVAVGLFWDKVGYFGHIFLDIDFNIGFFQSVRRSKSCYVG